MTSFRPPYPHGDPTGGPLWRVEARKYDGTLHYTLPAHLVADDGQCVWLHVRAGALLHHVTRGFERPMRRAAELLYWRSAWYNIYVNYHPGGDLDYFYCNVSLPPRINGTTLVFVDIDLDVAIDPGGEVRLLDADEFEAHRVRYGYPPTLQHNARLAVLDIITHWRRRQPPFAWLDGQG